ncbi:fungal-specific transcription factor domain-containing protein [Xylariaceae sp. FL0016]|nr:fungal-specific transcription factor domain-containing protein [Xylariaceae sp. FL0016]
MSEEAGPVLKRKRITVACNSCRSKKARCDGVRPVCGRCAGYGYTCVWGPSREGPRTKPSPVDSPVELRPEFSREIFERYQNFVTELCVELPENDRAEVSKSLACVQAHVRKTKSYKSTDRSESNAASTPRLTSQKYLGEISDIHFFNLVERATRGDTSSPEAEDGMDSYEHEDNSTTRRFYDPLAILPSEEKVHEYLETYFSIIHHAYPFVNKPVFLERLNSLCANETSTTLSPSWSALLYAILAIGAYYNSWPNIDTKTQPEHARLFERSLHLAQYDILEQSLTQVSALLAQCFCFLISSKIDRCWATLGLAVRLGQSIGLHANVEVSKSTHANDDMRTESAELRSRTWYSLYVLDRLVALQLGRPPAISDEDCHVSLPARVEDREFLIGSGVNVSAHEGASVDDYFIRIIEFSSIIGRVLREPYSPRRDLATRLQSTKNCDDILLSWKNRLPRFLRFDIGHAFEKSAIFKRQRNMLAIKFHHLRTLIHRPYLCFSWLRAQEGKALALDELEKVKQYERICVSEAQETARLMHNVADVTDIIQNFPWWQMISCLVCAGSILIAETCTRKAPICDVNSTALEADIEICMTVLEVLGANSNGAKRARDMMRKLRARSSQISGQRLGGRHEMAVRTTNSETQRPAEATAPPTDDISQFPVDQAFTAPLVMAENPEFHVAQEQNQDPNIVSDAWFGEAVWPLDVSDPMAWPVQFFDLLQGSHSSQGPLG